MTEIISQFEPILQTVPRRLVDISEADAAARRDPARWSKKEILGHLIDSASNNHQRIVRAQLTQPLEFPNYEQEGWVRTQAYNTVPWTDLVNLWLLLNRHLLHIVKSMPPEAFAREIVVGGKPPMQLSAVIAGYLDHLNHHLGQIFA